MTRSSAALWLLAVAGCASSPHQSAPSAPTASSSGGEAGSAPLGLPRDAAELNARVLTFLGRPASAAELSREQVERWILKLDAQRGDPQAFGAWGKFDGGWSYTLELRVEAQSGRKKLWLTYSGDDNASMGPVCAPDFEGFVKALSEAGYTYEKVYGEHSRFIAGSFVRGGAQLQVVPRGVSNEDAAHLCARMLILEAP